MFDVGDDPVPERLAVAIDRTWVEIGSAGTWWPGEARVEIAAVARAAWTGLDASHDLPQDAAAAAARISRSPAAATESWVRQTCDAIGELRYVELVGIVARTVAVDTFARLLGRDEPPLPAPGPGEPTETPPPADARRNRTWVAMSMPVPPYVLGAVPDALTAMNELCDELYMPPLEMGDPDWQRRTLHRSEMELVAATVSHENDCFY